jgi:hypothetical protein
LKKKAANDDPFGSDEEDEGGKSTASEKPASGTGVKKVPLRKKAKAEPEFEDEEDSDEKPSGAERKKTVPPKQDTKLTANKRARESDGESQDEGPKKAAKREGRK